MFVGKSQSRLPDEELLILFKKSGDLGVLGELFTRYCELIYGVCLKYLSDRERAKDAVMQVFETLPSKISNHEIEYFRGWIYVTTRNHCLMQIRAEKRSIRQEMHDNIVENDLILNLDGEEPLEENLGKLEKCIEKLGQDQRDCVKLFFMEEKTYKEISQETGNDLKKVKSYIQNGKRNLKICMETDE